MLVTDDVSQSPMGWLKEVAPSNMYLREGLCGGGGQVVVVAAGIETTATFSHSALLLE